MWWEIWRKGGREVGSENKWANLVMREEMSNIIDERQTAFIRERHLLHGVVIANEVVEEAKRGKKTLSGVQSRL